MVLIALVPTLVLGFLTASSTLERLRRVRTTREVARLTDRLSETLDVHTAIVAERLPTQAMQGAAAYGVDPSIVGLLVGFDPKKRLAETRPRVDEALASPEFSGVRAQLQMLRASAERGASIDEVNRTWNTLAADVNAMKQRDLDALRAAMDSTHQLEREFAALIAADERSSAIGDLSGGVFSLRSGTGEQRELRASLAVARSRAIASLRTLESDAGPNTREALNSTKADPQTPRALAAIDEVLNTPTRPLATDLVNSASQFTALLALSGHGNAEIIAATTDLRAAALRSSSNAKSSLAVSTVGMVGTTLFALFLAIWSARSIMRPLHRLMQRAQVVASGRLDGDPLDEEGPREVIQVIRAINDLVGSLGLLDKQVVALAEGNLDATCLQQELPGDLGQQMSKTVRLLSNSVSQRDQMQERLAHEASHDPLTGLANRHAVIRTLEMALRDRSEGTVACLFIDLDGFKRANDFYGHRFGDGILRLCADRLTDIDPTRVSVGRLGGDEFVLIAQGLCSREEALAIGSQVVQTISDPFVLDGHVCQIGASVGVALNSADSTASSIVRDADMAVYRAKQRGGGTVELFDSALREELAHRSEIEAAFQHALTTDELWIAYQPIVAAGDGESPRIESIEALVRWDRPGHGPVSPAEFVPVLEKGPFILELSRYVLRRGLRELHTLQQQPGFEHLTVNINLSVRDLSVDGVVEAIRHELVAAAVAPASLVIEITETALLTDVSVVTEHLAALRSLGVRIALDDFGTGYTSISQLAVLPVDIMKIDRSFTSLVTDPSKRAIVEMMIGVGTTLGLKVVAEGVETEAESALLTELGCTHQQGWLHGRPKPPADFGPATSGSPARHRTPTAPLPSIEAAGISSLQQLNA
jgi:diguanylate cyclase (GGDEF)-like protein